MSFKAYPTIGYGIETTSATPNLAGLQWLVSLTSRLKEEIDDFFKKSVIECPTLDDYSNFDEIEYAGVSHIVAKAIEEIEGLPSMMAKTDDENRVYILFISGCPFEYNKRERELGRNELDAIFRKYATVVFGTTPSPDFLTIIEYG